LYATRKSTPTAPPLEVRAAEVLVIMIYELAYFEPIPTIFVVNA
jgi:hypothetical protein